MNCPTCKELSKQIELKETTYEAIDLERALYKHQKSGECTDNFIEIAS